MKAWGLPAPDGDLGLLDLPVPEVGPGELLVAVAATSLNPIDALVATGRYPWGRFTYPVVPGWDFSGTVTEVGEGVTSFRPGDPVFGYWSKRTFGDGTWAEYAVMATDAAVAARPPALDHPQAAALPLAAVTALLALDAADPQPDEPLLVTGAGGAVGAYVVQLAAAAGAHVVVTAKPSDEARLRSWGAEAVIDYRCGDVAGWLAGLGFDRVPALVDIVHDAPEVTRLAELVEDGGRVASARFAADAEVLGRRGITVANVDAQRCGPAPLVRVADLVGEGRLEPFVDHVRPFDAVGDEVVRHLEGGRGKVAFVLDGR